jgi:hypothetical protein
VGGLSPALNFSISNFEPHPLGKSQNPAGWLPAEADVVAARQAGRGRRRSSQPTSPGSGLSHRFSRSIDQQ